MTREPREQSIQARPIVVLVIGVIAFFVFNQWRDTEARYNAAKLNELQHDRAYIASYQAENRQYQRMLIAWAPPVSRSEMDDAQNEIIRQLKAAGLEIQGIETVPETTQPGKKSSGVSFAVTVAGEWTATMAMLNNLRQEPVLVNLAALRMEAIPGSGSVRTKFGYKIYTEE